MQAFNEKLDCKTEHDEDKSRAKPSSQACGERDEEQQQTPRFTQVEQSSDPVAQQEHIAYRDGGKTKTGYASDGIVRIEVLQCLGHRHIDGKDAKKKPKIGASQISQIAHSQSDAGDKEQQCIPLGSVRRNSYAAQCKVGDNRRHNVSVTFSSVLAAAQRSKANAAGQV